MAEAPLVSIGMPVYNHARYVAAAIDDFLGQSYPNIELIISDDASSDETAAICQRYATDPRVRFTRQPRNIGEAANSRFTLEQATGTYFVSAASDDRHDAEFVADLLGALQSTPGAVSAFSPYTDIDEADRPIATMAQDYRGRTAIARLARFWLNPRASRDVWVYGLHLRSALLGTNLATWSGRNRRVRLNCAYPMLSYLLASGAYAYYEGRPLFRRRTVLVPDGDLPAFPGANAASRAWSMVLLKFEVLMVTCSAVRRASGSWSLGLAVAPIVFFETCRSIASYVLIGMRHRVLGIRRGYTP